MNLCPSPLAVFRENLAALFERAPEDKKDVANVTETGAAGFNQSQYFELMRRIRFVVLSQVASQAAELAPAPADGIALAPASRLRRGIQ